MSTVVPHRLLLTIEEVGARLRVSPRTVRRLIGRNDLPALRVGGQIRVDEAELEGWLYSDSVMAAQPSRGSGHVGEAAE